MDYRIRIAICKKAEKLKITTADIADIPYRWNKSFIALGLLYAKSFRTYQTDTNKQPVVVDGIPQYMFTVSTIVNCIGVRECLISVYMALVAEKVVPKIEQLERDLKQEYWKDTLKHMPGKPQAEQIKFLKAYYALANCIELYDTQTK